MREMLDATSGLPASYLNYFKIPFLPFDLSSTRHHRNRPHRYRVPAPDEPLADGGGQT